MLNVILTNPSVKKTKQKNLYNTDGNKTVKFDVSAIELEIKLILRK